LVTSCLATFVLIVIGGTVRATGSGDACPDWPRCHGQLLPPLETKVLIEFSHRLVASVVGFLVLAIAIVGWRSQRDPVLRWGGVVAVGLVIAQIILGGLTVLNDLSANLVTAHLALASTLFATLILLALVSIVPKPATASMSAGNLRGVALLSTIAVFAVMMTGSYVSGSGASLAFSDWPLFNGSVVPDGGRLAMIHATHRFAVLLLGLLLGYFAHQAGRANSDNALLRFGPAVVFALYLGQALVGAANIWTSLQPSAMAAHLALAELLWAVVVAIAATTQLLTAPTTHVTVTRAGQSSGQLRGTAAAGETS